MTVICKHGVLDVSQLQSIFGERQKELYYLPTYGIESGNLYRGSQAYMVIAFAYDGTPVGYGVIQLMPITHLKGIIEASVSFDTEFAEGVETCVGVNNYVRYIPIIDVLPEYQGKGIGTSIYNNLMSIGVKGIHPLSNTTIIEVTEESCGYWEKLGFKEIDYNWMVLRHRAY